MIKLVLLATILFSFVQSATAQTNPRFALLIGVGKYHPASRVEGAAPAAGRGIDLKSPPNDLALMQDLLSHYGFDDSNMLALVDEEATRDAIVNAVKDKLLSLPRGSLAVLYFSGHGSAVKASGAWDESIDETIVPYDGRVSGQPAQDIIDDEIYSWINELASKGITVSFIFDSCFSGGIARAPGLAEWKVLPTVEQPRGNRDGVLSLRGGGIPGASSSVAILTASDAREPAQALLFKDRYQGVFTTALHNALLPSATAKPPANWNEAIGRVLAALQPTPGEKPIQSPRIFGNRDALVFDSTSPFSNSVAAQRLSVGRAALPVGADVGVTGGSIFKLFGSGQVPWSESETFEARAKVVQVEANSAELEVIEGSLTSEALAAVEVEYAIPGRKIKVALPPQIDPFDRAAIRAGLGKFAELGEGRADLKISFADGAWSLETSDGRSISTSFPDGNSRYVADEIGKRFDDYARWRRLTDWKRNRAAASSQVRYRLLLETPPGQKLIEAADIGSAKIATGTVLRLMVENRATRPVQVDALLLRPSFTIDVCRLGVLERGQELSTEPVELGGQPGAAAWKIIVSDPAQQLSFLFLATDGARDARGASLEDEFARIWSGATAQPRAQSQGQSFWKTLDVPFQVMPAAGSSTLSSAPKRCLGIAQK